MTLFLIPLMSFLARAAGADWLKLKTVYGVIFGVVFGVVSGVNSHWVIGILCGLLSWRAYEFGHGTWYRMGGYQDHNSETEKPRIQTLERVFRPLYVKLGLDIYDPLYSWYMMGVKGFLIGVSAGWNGLLLTILWPVSYWIGHRVFKRPAIAEWISGACAGFVLFLALV